MPVKSDRIFVFLMVLWGFWFLPFASLIHRDVAEANDLLIQPTDVQIVRDGPVATVTARVFIRNYSFTPVTGLALVGGEAGPLKGQVLYVGAVPAEGEVVSDGVYSFSYDLSTTPLRNIMIPVVVQYSSGGEPMEVPGGLTYSFVE